MEHFAGLKMKTGMIDASENEMDSELEVNVAATVLTFTEKAVQLAVTYIEHNKRTEITPLDIKLGMAAEFFKFLDCPTLETDVEEWKNIILENKQSYSDSCSDEFDSEEEIEPLMEEIRLNGGCKCEFCEKFRKGEQILIDYEPKEQISIILKKQILKMCDS